MDERQDMDELKGIERIHLMGIGGSGMSALALLLSGMNFKVSGCDLARSGYIPRLEEQGIECVIGHSRSHIERFSPQLVVYSSAVDIEHEELIAARDCGAKTAGRGQVLSWIFNTRCGIGVAGTHGKTTTSSMIGLILERAGRYPSLAIGAEVCDIGTNARIGKSDLFVAEIDESDGSFEFFSPVITAITNVDWDHVNYFHTRKDVLDAFIRFSSSRKPGTPLIVCAEDEGSQFLIDALKNKDDGSQSAENIITCGWGESWNWGAFDVERKPGGGVVFSVAHNKNIAGKMELAVSGDHNIMNALVACAACACLNVPFDRAAEVLRDFKGAKRRLQKIGSDGLVQVIDDYGHHPTEITASLSALRDIYPNRRLVVVFQPHRYTRTRVFYREIASSLGKADLTLLLPIYSAGESSIEGVSSAAISDIMNGDGHCCVLCRDDDDALRQMSALLCKEDVLVTLGAGSVSHLGEAYLKRDFQLSQK